MNIEAVEETTHEINAALARLLPQLNPKLLYERLGFKIRETDVFRIALE